MKILEQLGLSKLADTHLVVFLGNMIRSSKKIVHCAVTVCKFQAHRASLKHAGLTANFFLPAKKANVQD